MTRFALLAALIIAATPPLAAQSIGLGVERLTSGHQLVQGLTGLELRFGSSVVGDRLAIRLGLSRLTGDHEREGSTCVGLMPSNGACSPESIHDETSFSRGRGELAVALLQRGRSSFGLVGGLVLGHLKSDSDGRTSGRHLSADKTVWGADIGAEGRWFPLSAVPAALEAAFAIGGLNPARSEVVVDGYSPFEQMFGVRRLRIGAVIELH